MDVTLVFEEFCKNLKIMNTEDISTKYRGITKKLNKKYYDSDSETSHCLQVGSYGRKTGINGISDLDMLFELPKSIYDKFDAYTTNGQSALLQEIKNTLLGTYSSSKINGDGQVVVIDFNSVKVEILPAFIQNDDTYLHPNSNNGGSWDKTDPRSEIVQMRGMNSDTNNKFRHLCRMVRAWKNKIGINMSGYLIDTLVYKFLNQTDDFDGKGYLYYDWLVRDFFKYLSEIDKDKEYWLVPGSNQRVYRIDNFVKKASKAYEKTLDAIEKNENKTVNNIWRELFGNFFPAYKKEAINESVNEFSKIQKSYSDMEEFIEDIYPVDIRNSLEINCNVTQNGFREGLLRIMPMLKTNKKLEFFIENKSINNYDKILWKIRNVGEEAEERNCLRGQIEEGSETKIEHTQFRGEHFVECYLIKDGICIAMDRIDVPISL